MLKTIDLRQFNADYSRAIPRAQFDVDHALESVAPICDAVRDQGLAALTRFSEQFDHVVPSTFRVPQPRLDEALNQLDPQLRDAIAESIRRRRQVCEEIEVEPSERSVELAPGARVTNRLHPISSVGLYVPGGLAPLASSVLMNVVPAQVAGVDRLAVATPPQAEFGGFPHPTILAVCKMLDVSEAYAVGGAQAIAMFAHGVAGLSEKVDLVTGPGNIYVVAAKRYLRGVVGIDAEAGPTEIAILADDTASPEYLAADLISQAEHDPLAASVLVTDSQKLAEAVRAEVERQTECLDTRDRLRYALSGDQSVIALVRDIDQGLAVVNGYGAEHLEIQTENAAQVAAQVTNAGALFVGSYSPVPLGDYSAGSTHVLPTGGASRYSSGLSVRSFMRSMHVVSYTGEALAELSEGIQSFAHAEHLPGHAFAVKVRQNK